MNRKKIKTLFYALAIFTAGYANNIQVSNVSLTGQNTTNKTVQVQFTVSWENSWRVSAGPGNWDAAWVFIKYRKGSGPWLHANLGADASHVAPAGSIINTGLLSPGAAFNATTNPGVGAFIYRSANGSGTFTVTNAVLLWNYGSNGLADNDVVDVQVFAIEHVYIPQADFAAGDGATDANQFTLTTINTSNATTAPSGSGSLGGQAGGYPTGQTAPDTSSWPNGFAAFYSMKYEISQQGYVDFLNTLDRAQQTNRVQTDISSGITAITNRYVMNNTSAMTLRNGIRCDATIHATAPVVFYCDYDGDGIGGETTDGKDIACNHLNWGDLVAYLDWAALRPLTEMEYEKCGRGNQLPLQSEYAWGTVVINQATSITNAGLPSEKPGAGANAVYGSSASVQGPLRVGSIAGTATSRQDAGAGYYGMMELSGNLWERFVSLGNASGKAFAGSHGNGLLNASGNSTNTDWPSSSTAVGSGFRGASWSNVAGLLRLSDRANAMLAISIRGNNSGGRGGRIAP